MGGSGSVAEFAQDLELVAGEWVGGVGQVTEDQVMIGSVEHHLAGRRQPDELGQREGGGGRAAPGGDHHHLHTRRAQRGQRMVGDVGAGQRVGIGGQDARDVDGDVAVADDHHPLVAQIEQ